MPVVFSPFLWLGGGEGESELPECSGDRFLGPGC